MTLPVTFSLAAQGEVAAAVGAYDEIGRDLGDAFIAHVDDALAIVSALPESKAVLYRDVRRIVLRRFPYSIFYRAQPTQIVVLGVRHQAANPVEWPNR